MKRMTWAMIMLAGFSGTAGMASAASWIFQPSYYSHEPVQRVKIGPPQEFGGPYYTRPAGDFYRSSYRYETYRLPNANGSSDTTNYFEGYRQIGGQY